jgi:hypothetical protein
VLWALKEGWEFFVTWGEAERENERQLYQRRIDKKRAHLAQVNQRLDRLPPDIPPQIRIEQENLRAQIETQINRLLRK